MRQPILLEPYASKAGPSQHVSYSVQDKIIQNETKVLLDYEAALVFSGTYCHTASKLTML